VIVPALADNAPVKGHECYHCKQWIADGEAHDCWTTTETALTKDLSEDLRDAYARLRETAIELGEQRVYASHSSIMFARKACYCFVRPKRHFLELVIFLGRAVKSPKIKKIIESSKVKRAHVIHVKHRDEVEGPLTDWLKEAFEFEPVAKTLKAANTGKPIKPVRKTGARKKTKAKRK